LGNVALLIGAVVTGLLIAGAWPLADYLQVSSPWVIVFTAIGLPVYFWQAVHRGLLQGELRFSRLATSYLAEAGVRMGAALALVALGMSAVGVAIGIALSFVASAVVAYDRRAHALGAPVHLPATLRATAISAAVLMVGQVVINNSDIVLAKALFEPEVAGVYASAALLGRAVFFLSWSVVHAAFPLAARSDTSAADRKRSVISAIVVVGGIGAAAVVGALLWADSVIPWLLGEEYVAAGELLPPYVMAASLFAIANLMASLDVARGRRLAALALVGSGVVQVIALLVWGQDPLAMVWVQVGVMAVAAVVVSGAWWWGEKQTLTVDIK
jgi:O-antigen/teichoic acid export membrane protein